MILYAVVTADRQPSGRFLNSLSLASRNYVIQTDTYYRSK